MRPVNLIPPEDRRGERAPTRTGILAYLVVAVLVLALVAATAVARLVQDEEVARARLEKLRSFSDFASLQATRELTVSTLAQSRFDWERVLRELSRVIPSDVWLVNLTGSVSPEVSVQNGAGIAIRAEVAGPALEIVGCARGQNAVARFVASLHDIDGVTRVTAAKSERPTDKPEPTSSTDDTGEECRTRDFIARFELVAAFDAVPVPPLSGSPVANPAPEGGGSEGSGTAEAEQRQVEASDGGAASPVPGG